jgi:hypothetical protein
MTEVTRIVSAVARGEEALEVLGVFQMWPTRIGPASAMAADRDPRNGERTERSLTSVTAGNE